MREGNQLVLLAVDKEGRARYLTDEVNVAESVRHDVLQQGPCLLSHDVSY